LRLFLLLLPLLLFEASCCCYCGFCNFHAWPEPKPTHNTHGTHPHTHTITLTLTPKHAKHQGLCAMQIPHGFSIFSNHFHGSPLPGHLSGHYAASRALIKQITVVRPRILALIETLLRARTRLVFGVLVSWWPGRVCGFLLPISASLPIVASPHRPTDRPLALIPNSMSGCVTSAVSPGLVSLFPGFVVAARGMHIVHLNWSRVGLRRVSFKAIPLLRGGNHLRCNSVDGWEG